MAQQSIPNADAKQARTWPNSHRHLVAAIPHHNDGFESLFICLRCIHVETHSQSGNALCNRASLRPDPKEHGITVEVFMRQKSDVDQLAS